MHVAQCSSVFCVRAVPNMHVFLAKDIFYKLAQLYGIFPEGTTKRMIKENLVHV